MSNNNFADISTFEQLQTEQNTKTAVSQMSAFQSDVAVENSVADAKKAIDALKKTIEVETNTHNAILKAIDAKRKTEQDAKQAYKSAFDALHKEDKRVRALLDKDPNNETLNKELKEIDDLLGVAVKLDTTRLSFPSYARY
jgi:hypothetical protein